MTKYFPDTLTPHSQLTRSIEIIHSVTDHTSVIPSIGHLRTADPQERLHVSPVELGNQQILLQYEDSLRGHHGHAISVPRDGDKRFGVPHTSQQSCLSFLQGGVG